MSDEKRGWCDCLNDGKHIHNGKLLCYKDGSNKDIPSSLLSDSKPGDCL